MADRLYRQRNFKLAIGVRMQWKAKPGAVYVEGKGRRERTVDLAALERDGNSISIASTMSACAGIFARRAMTRSSRATTFRRDVGADVPAPLTADCLLVGAPARGVCAR